MGLEHTRTESCEDDDASTWNTQSDVTEEVTCTEDVVTATVQSARGGGEIFSQSACIVLRDADKGAVDVAVVALLNNWVVVHGRREA